MRIEGWEIREIEGLVRTLREGDASAKTAAAQRLGDLAWGDDANWVLIAEAGGITPLVELLRDCLPSRKRWPARVLGNLARDNANKVLIAEAGGIPLLLELVRNARDGDWWVAKGQAAWALGNLARNNDANALAIALAVGLEAFAELARCGSVTIDGRSVVSFASAPAKRKAARVVAALLDDCVPESVPRDIRAVIGSYL
jgi:vacuolar protein 8